MHLSIIYCAFAYKLQIFKDALINEPNLTRGQTRPMSNSGFQGQGRWNLLTASTFEPFEQQQFGTAGVEGVNGKSAMH